MFVTRAGSMFVPTLGIMLCGTPKKGVHALLGASAISSRGLSTTSSRLGGPRLPSLTTLNPRQLSSSDFRCLSGKTQHQTMYETMFGPKFASVFFKQPGHKHPFPNGTGGFFYFHPGPTYAPIAGELRFRVVESTKSDDFNAGNDLLNICGGLPWSIPFPVLLQRKVYDAFASLLVHDYPSAFAPVMQHIEQKKLPHMTSNVNLVHSLGQPLYADVSSPAMSYRIANGSMVGARRGFHLFLDQRKTLNGAQVGTPYTGSCAPRLIYRFQWTDSLFTGAILYTLERAPDDNPLRCHVRVLDIIKPIALVDPNYDGYVPPPVKGKLIQKGGSGLRTILIPEVCALPDLETSKQTGRRL
jgi:hypothetical protein